MRVLLTLPLSFFSSSSSLQRQLYQLFSALTHAHCPLDKPQHVCMRLLLVLLSLPTIIKYLKPYTKRFWV